LRYRRLLLRHRHSLNTDVRCVLLWRERETPLPRLWLSQLVTRQDAEGSLSPPVPTSACIAATYRCRAAILRPGLVRKAGLLSVSSGRRVSRNCLPGPGLRRRRRSLLRVGEGGLNPQGLLRPGQPVPLNPLGFLRPGQPVPVPRRRRPWRRQAPTDQRLWTARRAFRLPGRPDFPPPRIMDPEGGISTYPDRSRHRFQRP
jgi:hypothetical protein